MIVGRSISIALKCPKSPSWLGFVCSTGATRAWAYSCVRRMGTALDHRRPSCHLVLPGTSWDARMDDGTILGGMNIGCPGRTFNSNASHQRNVLFVTAYPPLGGHDQGSFSFSFWVDFHYGIFRVAAKSDDFADGNKPNPCDGLKARNR